MNTEGTRAMESLCCVHLQVRQLSKRVLENKETSRPRENASRNQTVCLPILPNNFYSEQKSYKACLQIQQSEPAVRRRYKCKFCKSRFTERYNYKVIVGI